jgi:hypothetical protein
MKRRHYVVLDNIMIWADEQRNFRGHRQFLVNGMVIAEVPASYKCQVWSSNTLLDVV